MSESFPSRIRRAIEDNLAATIATSITGLLAAAWVFGATGIYRRLHEVLGDSGMLALMFGPIVVAILCVIGWRNEKEKNRPFFDRLIPVPGAGYSRDPKNGEFACPRCASEDKKCYLAQISDAGMYCQSCGHAVKRSKKDE